MPFKNKFFFLILILHVPAISHAFPAKQYYENKCLNCHSIGGGNSKGPDLLPVFLSKNHTDQKVSKHNRKWLIKFLKYPEGMIHGDVDEPGYEKKDQHVHNLWIKFNKKIMGDVELSKNELNQLIDFVEKTAKSIKNKKSKPLIKGGGS